MPKPSLMATVTFLVHEVSWTMASKEHQELPHEQDHEVVHWCEPQISSKNKLPNRGLNVVLIDALKNRLGSQKETVNPSPFKSS